MLTARQWMMRAGFAALCGCVASGSFADVDSYVPADWNITPLTNGVYIEKFDTEKTWMNLSGTANALVALSSLSYTDNDPARTNDWFAGTANALELDTEGLTITNKLGTSATSTLEYVDTTNPVYIDMLVRFDALEDGPDEEALADAKLALYVAEDLGLVCYSGDGYYTNYTAMASEGTNKWNRVTVKVTGTSFQVLMNDKLLSFENGTTTKDTFTTKSGAGTDSQLEQLRFKGTGHLTKLYVGYCDPAYSELGATEEVHQLASSVQADLSVTNVTKIQRWIQTSGTASTDDSAILAQYMVGETSATTENVELNIASLEVNPAANEVYVKLSMKVNETAKAGTVNGTLRLEGATTADGTYTVIEEKSFTGETFTDGESAELTFPLGSSSNTDYRFFKPVLSVQ